MPYHHGLLNQPDPDRPWGRPQVPQSLLSAAEEWGRNPQRPMVSPQGASIGPPQSRMSRIWDHLRHGIPRRVEEFLEPETPAGLVGLLGASVMEPAGTAIDVADFAAGFRDRDLPRMGWAAGGAALPFVAGSTMRKVLGKGVKGADELPMDEANTGFIGVPTRGLAQHMNAVSDPGFMSGIVRAVREGDLDAASYVADEFDLDTVTDADVASLVADAREAAQTNLRDAPDILTVYRSDDIVPGVKTVPVTLKRSTAQRFATMRGVPMIEMRVPKNEVLFDSRTLHASRFDEDELLVPRAAITKIGNARVF